MHLHSKPYAKIAIHERTEPFSLRLRNWAKDVEVGSEAPFRGVDDCVWFATKHDETIQISRTMWHWVSIEEAVDQFDHIRKEVAFHYVTSVKI